MAAVNNSYLSHTEPSEIQQFQESAQSFSHSGKKFKYFYS
uniref:Uncharacterized protein n=1 Tax=Anguilla anguilla TaxID=7936 RepID=A0A0E9SBI9_ANGAN